jgi:crotonobetainyl-CoA:carnitine CoA-transferase CaiB-like acyl-CoA transferase
MARHAALLPRANARRKHQMHRGRFSGPGTLNSELAMARPLDGVRILDFTRYQQGPYATVLLSDLGADVIKVEEPTNGDLGRALGRQPDGWCAYFEAHNRNKRSITVDLRKPEGREIVLKLVREVDVVTDNFRPGVMKRLGLDYDALSQVNARIITGSACGFGPKGPMANDPSFDIIGQGMGGVMSNQGGGPDEEPIPLMSGAADQIGAMVFALGITAAIVARDRQGVGQHVDVSLLGSQVALQALQLTGYMRGEKQHPTPARGNPVFTYFPCRDGKYLTIGILDPKWWPALCHVLEREDLLTNERFVTPRDRQLNRLALLDELDASFKKRERAYWIPALKKADVPCGPVHDYAGVASEPQVIENQYITSLEHPSLGPVRVVNSPIRMSKMDVGAQHTAPELGEHTEAILLDIGYSWEDIEKLKDGGVI